MNNEVFDYMKVNKNSLKNIIKDNNIINILHDAIFRVNKIIFHTYNFLKLYILYLYDNNLSIPLINEHFIRIIMKIISIQNDNRGRIPNKKTIKIINKLTIFFDNHYKKTIDSNDIIYSDKLSSILSYEAIDIVKNINTNISSHYVDHLAKFISYKFHLKDRLAEINKNKKLSNDTKKQLKKNIYQEFYNIKFDILNVKNNKLCSLPKYHSWIKNNKFNLIPRKNNYRKKNINYDICCNPQDYLKCLIFINKQLNLLGNDNNPIKLFNVLPLKTRIIPSYITLDTACIINLFIESNKLEYLSNISEKKEEVWNKFFKIDKKVFKKNNYQFNYMIKTDGIACSILFIKLDSNNEPIKLTHVLQLRKLDELRELKNNQYIENQPNIDKLLKGKNYVCIDPNLSDLLYCMDKNGIKFRYTQNQRRSETKNKKYMKIIEKINRETKIDNKSIKEIESELSNYNSKTCDFNRFMDYLKIKNKINRILLEQYQKEIYRKLKWNRFINTQKSENKMIKNFEKKYGNPKLTNVIIGDFDKGNNHMKGKEPCITKRLRKILRSFGYNVYLINEYNTSKICNNCNHEVENFKKMKSNKPKNKGKNILVWGLVRCKNENCNQATIQNKRITYKTIYNRDTNAVLNMLYIIKTLIKTGKRPKLFTYK